MNALTSYKVEGFHPPLAYIVVVVYMRDRSQVATRFSGRSKKDEQSETEWRDAVNKNATTRLFGRSIGFANKKKTQKDGERELLAAIKKKKKKKKYLSAAICLNAKK